MYHLKITIKNSKVKDHGYQPWTWYAGVLARLKLMGAHMLCFAQVPARLIFRVYFECIEHSVVLECNIHFRPARPSEMILPDALILMSNAPLSDTIQNK